MGIFSKEDVEDVYPLSDIQKGMIYHAKKEQGVYHDQIANIVHINNFDSKIFERALILMIEKHEMLRTSFFIGEFEEDIQAVFKPKAVQLDYRYHDISHLDEKKQQMFIDEDLLVDRGKAFTLSNPGLWRSKNYKLSSNYLVTCFIFHHAILDGWSNASFHTELNNLYLTLLADIDFRPLPLKSSYKDYVLEEQLIKRKTKVVDFWKNELANYTRFSFADTKGTEQYLQRGNSFPRQMIEELELFAKDQGTSLKTVCYTAFLYCLRIFSYSNDLTTGLVTNNRPLRDDGEKILGCFVNTIPFRIAFSETASWSSLVRHVHRKLVAIKEYDFTSLPDIMESIGEPTTGRNPFFDVVFNYNDFYVYAQANELNTIDSKSQELEKSPAIRGIGFEQTNIGFDFTVDTTSRKLSYTVSYLTSFASTKEVESFQRSFELILKNISLDPLPKIKRQALLPSSVWAELLHNLNDTIVSYPSDQTVLDLFEKQVEMFPEKVALSFEGKELSYKELNFRSNQVAKLMKDRGFDQNQIIGILLDRSIDLVIGIYGIMKLGSAFLAVDPSYPLERINYIIVDSGVGSIISSSKHYDRVSTKVEILDFESLPDGPVEEIDILNKPKAADLAYLLYTSGSTGKPKGTMIGHSALFNYLSWAADVYIKDQQCPMALFTSISFDLTLTSLFLPLSTGNTLFIYDAETQAGLVQRVFQDKKAKVVKLTPSHLRILRDSNADFSGVVKLIVGGEEFKSEIAKAIYLDAHGELEIFNEYGPTEGTIGCTFYKFSPTLPIGDNLPIGKPVPNTQVYILDDTQNLLATGAVGEICIGGLQLFKGYYNQDVLTNDSLVKAASIEDSKIYRTGDVGRWTTGGNIEFLGRLDDQIKIRGFRVELGEIESEMTGHEGIKDAFVKLDLDEQNEKRLIGYFVRDNSLIERSENHAHHQVKKWETIFNDSLEVSKRKMIDPTFNLAGWTSSYDNEEIPEAEMKEWLQTTVDLVLSSEVENVLEIGCGVGLVLFKVAPHCRRYVASDINESGLAYILENIDTKTKDKIELHHCEAKDFSKYQNEYFDTIILNSVVQYFPDLEYLDSVIAQAVELLAPDGKIIIGDVRSLPLLESYHTSLVIKKCKMSTPISELKKRIQRGISQEKELLIDPHYFHSLVKKFPVINNVQILPKHGSFHNELTKFRYETIIYKGDELPKLSIERWDWIEMGLDAASLQKFLMENQPRVIGVVNIPNVRLTEEEKVLRHTKKGDVSGKDLTLSDMLSVDDLIQGVELEFFDKLREEICYEPVFDWTNHGVGGKYDVFLVDNRKCPNVDEFFKKNVLKRKIPNVKKLANDPLLWKNRSDFISGLRMHIEKNLPEYMMPSFFIQMESFPMTSNGKIDQKSLPNPEIEIGDDFVAPFDSVEEKLVGIWSETLNVDRKMISVNVSFFELGGHSLNAMNLLNRVDKQLGSNIPLKVFFDIPTVRELGNLIKGLEATAYKSNEELGKESFTI